MVRTTPATDSFRITKLGCHTTCLWFSIDSGSHPPDRCLSPLILDPHNLDEWLSLDTWRGFSTEIFQPDVS
jgi:hypothetical protein